MLNRTLILLLLATCLPPAAADPEVIQPKIDRVPSGPFTLKSEQARFDLSTSMFSIGAKQDASPLSSLQSKLESPFGDLAARWPMLAPEQSKQLQAQVTRDAGDSAFLLPAVPTQAPIRYRRFPAYGQLPGTATTGINRFDLADPAGLPLPASVMYGNCGAGKKELSPQQTAQFERLIRNEVGQPSVEGSLALPKATAMPDLDTKLKAEVNQAKTQMPADFRHIQSTLQATMSKPISMPDLPRSQSNSSLGSVCWDLWYLNFSVLSKPLLVRMIERSGCPAGQNRLSITVSADHTLTVEIVKHGQATFDRATKQAYLALSGDRRLQFPSGSRRQKVTFFIDNAHQIGEVSSVSSLPCVGDIEYVHN